MPRPKPKKCSKKVVKKNNFRVLSYDVENWELMKKFVSLEKSCQQWLNISSTETQLLHLEMSILEIELLGHILFNWNLFTTFKVRFSSKARLASHDSKQLLIQIFPQQPTSNSYQSNEKVDMASSTWCRPKMVHRANVNAEDSSFDYHIYSRSCKGEVCINTTPPLWAECHKVNF